MRLVAIIMVMSMLLFSFPAKAAGADSWEEVERILARAVESGDPTPSFTLGRELLAEMRQDADRFRIAAARAGCRSVAWTWWTDGRVEITQMEPFGCPVLQVKDKDGLLSAVRKMRDRKEKNFVLIPDPAFYASLMADPAEKKALLLEGGLYGWDTEYHSDSTCCLEYVSCSYWNGSVYRVTGEKELSSRMRDLASSGQNSFAFLLDGRTWDSMMTSDCERLKALETAAFIRGDACSFYTELRILIYCGDAASIYYPGYEILCAVRAGDEDRLSPTLKATLRAARQMVSSVYGTDEEMTLAIHDMLCRHITYRIDDTTDSDDCCVGAILNGEANCDGYSDAFLLMCGLKGIRARLISGDSRKISPNEDPAHMWNLVLLKGLWRGVDVTWDDGGKEIVYENYGMGWDRMLENYRFIADFMPENMLQSTDLKDRPVPEFMVKDADGVCAALRETAQAGRTQAVLRLDERLWAEYLSPANPVWEWLDLAGVEGRVSYSDTERKLIITDITPLGADVMTGAADSESGVIGLMRSASGAREMRIYLSPGLYARYRESDNPVWKWLDMAGITGNVSYSDAARRVIVSDISPLGPGVLTMEAETSGELIRLLSGADKTTVREVRIYCSESLFSSFASDMSRIWAWLESGGVSDASIRYSAERRGIFCVDIRWQRR